MTRNREKLLKMDDERKGRGEGERKEGGGGERSREGTKPDAAGREQQRRRLPVCARVKHGNIPIYRYSCYTVHEAPKKFRRHSKFTSSQTCVTDDEVSSSVPRVPPLPPHSPSACTATPTSLLPLLPPLLYTPLHAHHCTPPHTTIHHRTPPHTAHHLAPDFTQCSFGVKMKVVLK
jgi:hypothetical protein